MNKSEIDPRILGQIRKLEQKYEVMGQDISSYLDGLLYSDYLTYWDYVHLDTLLSLQTPKTSLKDEVIFIIYHQITELYFKLVLWEMKQLSEKEDLTEDFFVERVTRIIHYFDHLISSFDIMVDGMEKEQFLKFRMALLPASGFQSAQYRLIEITFTDLLNLVPQDQRASMQDAPIDKKLEKLYWQSGATELATGKKTLTLKQFEEKYFNTFREYAEKYKTGNLCRLYQEKLRGTDKGNIATLLKDLDIKVNINWALAHYKSAARYLQRDPKDIAATGGTNWQKYLPPRFQKVYFFPELLTDKEMEDWGKSWVKKEVFNR